MSSQPFVYFNMISSVRNMNSCPVLLPTALCSVRHSMHLLNNFGSGTWHGWNLCTSVHECHSTYSVQAELVITAHNTTQYIWSICIGLLCTWQVLSNVMKPEINYSSPRWNPTTYSIAVVVRETGIPVSCSYRIILRIPIWGSETQKGTPCLAHRRLHALHIHIWP